MNVLIDTTVWFLYYQRRSLNKKEQKIVDTLQELIDEQRAVILEPIRQELLSGISDKGMFEHLKESLLGFNINELQCIDYELAAEYSILCRKQEIPSSPTDLLLCAAAIRNCWEIFTEDRDFINYKKYMPIKLYVITDSSAQV